MTVEDVAVLVAIVDDHAAHSGRYR